MKISYIPYSKEVYQSTSALNIIVVNTRFELKERFTEIGLFKITGKIDISKLKEEASIYGADALVIEEENVTLVVFPNKKKNRNEKDTYHSLIPVRDLTNICSIK